MKREAAPPKMLCCMSGPKKGACVYKCVCVFGEPAAATGHRPATHTHTKPKPKLNQPQPPLTLHQLTYLRVARCVPRQRIGAGGLAGEGGGGYFC